MGIRTTTYVMVGADVGSALKDRYPGDDELYNTYREMVDWRQQKAGKLAIVEECEGKHRCTRVGLLLADPLRDDEPGSISVALSPQGLRDLIPIARKQVSDDLGLVIEPQLLVFTDIG